MKKYLRIMTAVAVILCGLVISGCGIAKALKDAVEDSYNQWYKYQTTTQLNIPVLSASEADTEGAEEAPDKLANAEIYLYYDLDKGLTVAVQSKAEQEVSLLGGLYTNSVVVPMGGTTQVSKEKFNGAAWSGLVVSGKIEKSDIPEIVEDPDSCIVISGEDASLPKIQWKRFISNYLIEMLGA